MAVTQLSLYNGALHLLKERKLASLTENREPRRVLDDVWEGAVDACLEQGQWNFAMRTAKFAREETFVPAFGYENQFLKPSDLIRVCAVCSDEFFNSPLTQYTDEAGSWYSSLSDIYVSYISNDATAYGGLMSRWPQTFVNVVEHYLAMKAGARITGKDNDEWIKKFRLALVDGRSKDAMNEPTKFMPQVNWTSARAGNSRLDRGNRGQLIG